MPSALSTAGGAVPYDAYCSPDHHLHDQSPASSHAQHQQQAATPGAAAVSSSVRQPWYEMSSDGAVTPPRGDDSSSSSNRGEFLPCSHVPAGGAILPHPATRRRPLGCRLTLNIFTDLLLLAALAVSAYFLRYHIHRVRKKVCFRLFSALF